MESVSVFLLEYLGYTVVRGDYVKLVSHQDSNALAYWLTTKDGISEGVQAKFSTSCRVLFLQSTRPELTHTQTRRSRKKNDFKVYIKNTTAKTRFTDAERQRIVYVQSTQGIFRPSPSLPLSSNTYHSTGRPCHHRQTSQHRQTHSAGRD